MWYFIEERQGARGKTVNSKRFRWLRFYIFSYVRLLTTQLRGDTTQLRGDTTQLRVDTTQLRVDTTRLRVDTTRLRGDTTQLRVDTLTMQEGASIPFLIRPSASCLLPPAFSTTNEEWKNTN